MTELQISLLAGALITLGPILVIVRYVPQQPSLKAYLEAVTTSSDLPLMGPVTPVGGKNLEDRLGLWLQRHLGQWMPIPTVELELLRIPPHRFLAQKASFAMVGLLIAPVVSAVLWMVGLPLPVAIPVVASVALAIALSFIPDANARSDAARARAEFSYVLAAFMDLVALERRAGASTRQALEEASRVGDSWVFQRIDEELARSAMSGVSPWEMLGSLGERFGVPELVELGHVMKLAGAENAGVYDTLKQRAKALRKSHLALEQTEANEISTKRSMPVALLGMVFMALLVAPALLSVALSGS